MRRIIAAVAIKNYGFEMAFSGNVFISDFVKINQKLKRSRQR
jgi:hypothetical protein